MTLTNNQLEERIISLELKNNDVQTALNALATKRQLKTIMLIRQNELDDHDTRITANASEITVLQDAFTGMANHGNLIGLTDDDHTQYLNTTRGDARYYTQAQVDLLFEASGSNSHSSLTSLDNDDHLQYHTDARGDARYFTQTQLNNGQLDGLYAALGHLHDDRYYTEGEIDTLLTSKVSLTGNEVINGSKTFIDNMQVSGDLSLRTGQKIIFDSEGAGTTYFNLAAASNVQVYSAGQYVMQWVNGITKYYTATTFLGNVLIGDDVGVKFGVPDYWFIYNSSAMQFEFWTTNGNGSGTDSKLFSVVDGTDDIRFYGAIEASGLTINGLSDFAASGHSHIESDITDLQSYALSDHDHIQPFINTDTVSGLAVVTLDFSTNRLQILDLEGATGDVTVTISGTQEGGMYGLQVIQGSVARDIIWPGTVLWPGGTAPVISATEDDLDFIQLLDIGSNYLGLFNQAWA